MNQPIDVHIEFIHDSKTQIFESGVNKLTGDHMYTFDNWQGCYVAENKNHVKGIIKNLFNRAKIVSYKFTDTSFKPSEVSHV